MRFSWNTLVGLVFVFISGISFADVHIGKIDAVNNEQNYILINDLGFYFVSNSIIVNQSGSQSNTLLRRSLMPGVWVRVESEYLLQEQKRAIQRIEVITEKQALDMSAN